jgi:hypothetical protein
MTINNLSYTSELTYTFKPTLQFFMFAMINLWVHLDSIHHVLMLRVTQVLVHLLVVSRVSDSIVSARRIDDGISNVLLLTLVHIQTVLIVLLSIILNPPF